MSVVITVELHSGLPNSPVRSNSFFRWINHGQTLVIGRSSSSADMVINDDPLISSQHFAIESHGDTCTVRDLGSTNGTFINDKSISEVPLDSDAYVIAGRTRFHIHLPEGRGVSANEIENEAGQEAVNETDEPSEVTLGNISPAAKAPSGWDIELAAWPEPMSEELHDEIFEHQSVIPRTRSELANLVLMLHESCSVAMERLQSRPIAWISSDQSIVVGRSVRESDWAITADPYISGSHFRITNENGKCTLENLSKTNGTWVNGECFEFTLLRDNDLVRAGETVFQIGIEGGVSLSDQDIRIASIKKSDA